MSSSVTINELGTVIPFAVMCYELYEETEQKLVHRPVRLPSFIWSFPPVLQFNFKASGDSSLSIWLTLGDKWAITLFYWISEEMQNCRNIGLTSCQISNK